MSRKSPGGSCARLTSFWLEKDRTVFALHRILVGRALACCTGLLGWLVGLALWAGSLGWLALILGRMNSTIIANEFLALLVSQERPGDGYWICTLVKPFVLHRMIGWAASGLLHWLVGLARRAGTLALGWLGLLGLAGWTSLFGRLALILGWMKRTIAYWSEW